MITDTESAILMQLIYAHKDDNDLGTAFDYYDPGSGPSGVCWASKVVDGETIIWLRGSVTFWDWAKDALAFTLPWDHDVLGPVHPGFEMGMERLTQAILTRTKGPRKLRGHSLGAGRGSIVAGLLKEAGCPPADCVWWGQPKPGFAQLREYLKDIPTRSYRNGTAFEHDVVTDGPLTFPPEEYVHPTGLTLVSAAPAPEHSWLGLFRCHHMGLYAQAMVGISA